MFKIPFKRLMIKGLGLRDFRVRELSKKVEILLRVALLHDFRISG